MSIAIVIPARLASSRLPEKMLLNATGWPLIRHTYEQAKKATLADRVIIATDDERIAKIARDFGAECVMTSKDHATGSDRLAEVAKNYLSDVDGIINVQGDEPELEPANIDRLIRLFQSTPAPMATLVTPFAAQNTQGVGSPLDPNCVKAILGKAMPNGHQALYFSRSLIPYPRDHQGIVLDPTQYFLHIGIYAYQPEFLKTFVTLPQGSLERAEKLEQLRALEHGFSIVADVVERATPGIDTQADYDQFVQRWQAKEAIA